MTIEEIVDATKNGGHKYIERERERQRKLVQKAKTKNAMIAILAILCFPITLFVLVIAELIHTTE